MADLRIVLCSCRRHWRDGVDEPECDDTSHARSVLVQDPADPATFRAQEPAT